LLLSEGKLTEADYDLTIPSDDSTQLPRNPSASTFAIANWVSFHTNAILEVKALADSTLQN
jgi:hypothetical protein